MFYKRYIPATCLSAALAAAVACGTTEAPTEPTPIVTVSAPRVLAITVTGPTGTLIQRGQTVQLRAMASLSNGLTEDKSSAAQWQSTNNGVASVNGAGVVTAGDEGEADIRATIDGQTGTYRARVRYASRTPNPAPGQALAFPAYAESAIREFANERPDLLSQSCPQGIKYVNNPWQDYIVDRLRILDTRWGYNAKPTRTAADNGGVPVVAAGDEIAYNYSADPDEGTTNVYLIDILVNHCGPTPSLTFRHFTGEEPGRWTGAGRF